MSLAIASYLQRGDVIYLPVPDGGVVVGGVYVIGALVVVATATASPGNMFTARLRGVFEVTKVGSQAWAVGDRVYWDADAQAFTTEAEGNTFGGVCIKAVGSGASETRARMRLGDATAGESASGGGASLIHQASVTLTDAQIKALPSLGKQIAGSPGAGRFIVVSHGLWYLDTDEARYDTSATQASWQLLLGTVRVTAIIKMGALLNTEARVFGAFLTPEAYAAVGAAIPNSEWFWNNVYTYSFSGSMTDQALVLQDVYSGLADYGDGDPLNSGWVAVEFRVFDVATRRFLTTVESGYDETTRTFA